MDLAHAKRAYTIENVPLKICEGTDLIRTIAKINNVKNRKISYSLKSQHILNINCMKDEILIFKHRKSDIVSELIH